VPKKPSGRKLGQAVTRARIIEAAAQRFAHRGFAATSTRDISKLAKVNEVTLFRYFPRKVGLFAAAVESRLARVRMSGSLQTKLAKDAPIADVVPALIDFLTENFLNAPELIRLLYVAGLELPAGDMLVREYLGPCFDSIQGYFERSAVNGIIEVHPIAATLSLAGIVCSQQDLYRLFTGKELGWDAEQYGKAYRRFLLNALGGSASVPTPVTSALQRP
jgi:AcrR family transcriptional regulator